MTGGPGPYTAIADELLRQFGAQGVVLVVVGPHGQPRDVHEVSFFSVEQLRRSPAVLRAVADEIERDLKRLSPEAMITGRIILR